MKVLLINPWGGEVFPTPAIGYLQATLKAAGADVTAVDLSGAFQETDYDIVGVTFHSFSVKEAQRIRHYYLKNRLICGGHHPSALPYQMLAIGYDQVVIGEGEKAIIDIINGNTAPLVYGELSDINSIPFPDYTGLSFTGAMGVPVITSRGCGHACNFCASSHFWNRRYRARSVENVLAELKQLTDAGIKTWMKEDDNFTANKRRAIEICKGIAAMGQFNWQCASRAESLDKELCIALKESGCRTVWLGIESLSQPALDRCNKNTTIDKMLTGIEIAEETGIETMCQFIIGLPGDTMDDIQTTVQNIRRSRIRRKGTNILWVVPGTDAYNKAKQQGFSDDTYLKRGAPYYTYEQDMTTLNYWAYLINAA
jgi:anaerobic magnesium-protoporphyrin IX monomethyl ester cyclase